MKIAAPSIPIIAFSIYGYVCTLLCIVYYNRTVNFSMEKNTNSRLEAFCDGVFAIALTLLIIDIKLPSSSVIKSDADVWLALRQILPSVFTFVLSFAIILITWVNHHGALKQVHKSSPSFIYANGFLLLTVVFIPFPTALMGESLFTNYAAPAVVLYIGVIVLQSIGWIFIFRAAIQNELTVDDRATAVMRKNMRMGYYTAATYSVCAIMAFWYPMVFAILITLLWGFWLVYGIRVKNVAHVTTV